MKEPLWLTRAAIDAMHFDQLREHGGLPGVRDENALESALARPANKWAYGDKPSVFELAAAYGFAIARNHPFSDGNKRTAFMAMYVFLGVNGWEIVAVETEVVAVVLELAGGKLNEAALTRWLERNSERGF